MLPRRSSSDSADAFHRPHQKPNERSRVLTPTMAHRVSEPSRAGLGSQLPGRLRGLQAGRLPQLPARVRHLAGSGMNVQQAMALAGLAKLKAEAVAFQSDVLRGPRCRMAVCLDGEGNSLLLHQLNAS